MKKEQHADPLRFSVIATDTIVFTLSDNNLLVRLIKVNRPPFFVNMQGLPGGLIDPKENADQSARRHIETKSHIYSPQLYIEQLYTFSEVERDRRGRVISIAYTGLIAWNALCAAEQKHTPDTWWSTIKKAHKLAYDHDTMLTFALKRLRSRIIYTTLISKLMPTEFTLTELENAYEAILDTKLDKRNFRKKILKLDIVIPTKDKRSGGRFRPAQLYRFASNIVHDVDIL